MAGGIGLDCKLISSRSEQQLEEEKVWECFETEKSDDNSGILRRLELRGASIFGGGVFPGRMAEEESGHGRAMACRVDERRAKPEIQYCRRQYR